MPPVSPGPSCARSLSACGVPCQCGAERSARSGSGQLDAAFPRDPRANRAGRGRQGFRVERGGAALAKASLSRGQACVHQHAVCISLPTGRGRGGAVLWWGTSPHYGPRISSLNRQDVPPGTGRAGQIGPARDQLCRRHLRAGEEPPGLQLTLAVAAQPAQAHRFTRRHPFEDLRPLLSRRTSPNVPSDNSIAAPVGRLPQGKQMVLAPRRTSEKCGKVPKATLHVFMP